MVNKEDKCLNLKEWKLRDKGRYKVEKYLGGSMSRSWWVIVCEGEGGF